MRCGPCGGGFQSLEISGPDEFQWLEIFGRAIPMNRAEECYALRLPGGAGLKKGSVLRA